MRTLLALLFLITPALSQRVSSVAELIPENSSIAPGKPFTLALHLQHPENWHSYYLNSGGVELPPSITWNLPAGSTAGPLQFPVPNVYEVFDGKSFIYPGAPAFLVEITPPPGIAPGDSFSFTATANWQICEQLCIDENAEFTINLAVTEEPQLDPEQSAFFAEARSQLPITNDLTADATIERTDTHLVFHLPNLNTAPTDFIPDQLYLRAFSEDGKAEPHPDGGYLLTIQRRLKDFLDDPIPQGKTISGILITDKAVIFPETPISSPPPAPIAFSALLPILWGMLIGGMILNLMPCVFPVIGLKIMNFVQQSGENRRSIALHGFTFTAGVIASFAVLSGFLFVARVAALRSGGDFIGWGYQLQNPMIVLILMLLMFVLALNMFGLFEIGASATSVGGKLQSKSGHSGSFFSGVLATVVATPCSAPFLGVAIGAAMALPALQFFSAFFAMALGLALPYLILSIFPQLVEKLPRPGPWMESFKQGMSFLLFATAAFLLWVYSGLIGQEKLLAPLLGLSLIATAAWIYGRWNLPHRPKRTRLTAGFLAITFALGGLVLALPPKPDELWKPWSQETVETLLESGSPVYIDFTAQWCVTCQVNKKFAYTQAVLELAEEKNIVFLKADKTRPSPAIENALNELGRTAIPVNVLIIPGKDPIITPELLTPSILIGLFNQVP